MSSDHRRWAAREIQSPAPQPRTAAARAPKRRTATSSSARHLLCRPGSPTTMRAMMPSDAPRSPLPRRGFGEMQDAGKERIARLRRPADIDEARALELIGEHVDDALERFVVERTEGVIDEDPGGLLQHDARECEGNLLVLAQFAVPAGSDVE